MDTKTSDDMAYHRAVGWLTAALESVHPGFIAGEAARADEKSPEVAAVLRSWCRASATFPKTIPADMMPDTPWTDESAGAR